jgi:hypothetical protein
LRLFLFFFDFIFIFFSPKKVVQEIKTKKWIPKTEKDQEKQRQVHVAQRVLVYSTPLREAGRYSRNPK